MEWVDILRYAGALILVLGLVGLAGLGAKRFGIPGVARGVRDKRLAIVESLMLGSRQRLLIIRRDNVEHLILSHAGGAQVIETGIAAKPSAARQSVTDQSAS